LSLSSNPSIVIVHVNEPVAENMLALPLRKAGFPILAISHQKENLIPLLTQHQPDILIINLSFYDPDVRWAVAERFPQLKVVVVTVMGSDGYFATLAEYLFEEGRAHAFIGLGDTYNLVDAVSAAARNELYLSQSR
jgi:DNA-binding NarL/FixJ family response regulator